jgi:predicted DsbA family dithiol-disulfide isomerase
VGAQRPFHARFVCTAAAARAARRRQGSPPAPLALRPRARRARRARRAPTSPTPCALHARALSPPRLCARRCFIGLRRLQRALASSPDVAATLRYVPYVFDPHTPAHPPLTWRAYVALRYPERAQHIYTQKLPYTLAQAASEGIVLHDYENRPVCPTVDALCLLKAGADAGRCVTWREGHTWQSYAKRVCVCVCVCADARACCWCVRVCVASPRPARAPRSAAEVVEQLLSQHFERGRDTSDAAVLRDCGDAAGLDAAAVAAALAPDSAARKWVWDEDARARAQLRVTGVPHYAISLARIGDENEGAAVDDAALPPLCVTLDGAQPPSAWRAAFDALRRAGAARAGAARRA